MTFQECCVYCAGNAELVKEFNRLSGYQMGKKRTPAEMVVDEACGYDPDREAFTAFLSFVYDYIWLPLTQKEEDA